MIEASQLIDPAISFFGAATGVSVAWSYKAFMERQALRKQIKLLLQDLEKPLLEIYQAIADDDNTSARSLRNVLDDIGRSLEARLERYLVVYDLSGKPFDHIVTQASYAQLIPAVAKFAENYTSFRSDIRQGKNSFAELMALSLSFSDAELKGTPDALDKLRKKYDLHKLSKEIRSAHANAVAAVDKHRKEHDYDTDKTRGHDTFLDDSH